MDVSEKVYHPVHFYNKKVYYHPEFEEDLKNLIEKSGIEGNFKPLLKQRMDFLEERMEECTRKSNWFEKLKYVDGFYAMRFNKRNKNIRVIFIFSGKENEQIIVLLCNFEEKDKKDYNKAIDLAIKRRGEIQRGYDLEREEEN